MLLDLYLRMFMQVNSSDINQGSPTKNDERNMALFSESNLKSQMFKISSSLFASDRFALR
jgi:hypothetical protein